MQSIPQALGRPGAKPFGIIRKVLEPDVLIPAARPVQTQPRLKPRPYGFASFLVVLTAIAAFRLIALALNGTDLYVDEAQYWSWSRDLDFGYFSKPPLIAWIIASATSACGDGEFCVRLPSVAIHLATSIVVYSLGRRLASEEVGFWSGIGFATLPGISLSSGIISTDVPLLFAWALALLAFAELVIVPTITMAVVLGVALGLGLNAKYAMAYFIPCAALFFVLAPHRRRLLGQPYLLLSAGIAALLMLPNIAWNFENGFLTFAHTADNANWNGSLFHPGKALEFLGSQFGVFGPVMFGALLVIAWRTLRRGSSGARLTDAETLLLSFSIPIIAALAVQGLLSRSLANWAAPAYVAATILVVATLVRTGAYAWLRAAVGINAAIAVAIAIATSQAGTFVLPGGSDPFARTLGNRSLVDMLRTGLAANAERNVVAGSILTDDREIAAAFAYYGRDLAEPVYSWREGGKPRHHFELKRPFPARAAEPVLLVSRRADGSSIPQNFRSVLPLGPVAAPAGDYSERTVYLFELSGFKGGQQ